MEKPTNLSRNLPWGIREKYMIRDGDSKYTFWLHDSPELYDLRKDPEEMHNLASQTEYQKTI